LEDKFSSNLWFCLKSVKALLAKLSWYWVTLPLASRDLTLSFDNYNSYVTASLVWVTALHYLSLAKSSDWHFLSFASNSAINLTTLAVRSFLIESIS